MPMPSNERSLFAAIIFRIAATIAEMTFLGFSGSTTRLCATILPPKSATANVVCDG